MTGFTDADVTRYAALLPQILAAAHGCDAAAGQCDLLADTEPAEWRTATRAFLAALAADGRLVPPDPDAHLAALFAAETSEACRSSDCGQCCGWAAHRRRLCGHDCHDGPGGVS